MSKRILTKKKFIEWLEDKHPRTKVGAPGDCLLCPIAKFVVQTTGIPYVITGYGYASPPEDLNTRYVPLPKWALDFIDEVDECTTTYITAKKCLELLKAA